MGPLGEVHRCTFYAPLRHGSVCFGRLKVHADTRLSRRPPGRREENDPVEIEWTIAEAQGKTDAEKVAENIAELDGATSGDVVLPNDATVSISGNTVTVTIGEASGTFTVPEYYDVSADGSTVTLVLNELALPTIADTVEAEVVTTPAIQVVGGTIKLNVTSARNALWYGLKVAAALPANWGSIDVETWVSGDGLHTLTGVADDDAGFYKIVVTDVDPTPTVAP